MREVNAGRKLLADYQSIILKDLYREIAELAEPLRGRRVLHVNATAVGGIPLQIDDGKTGFLVTSIADCAARSLWILSHPQEAQETARRGKEYVREHFLTPRLVRDDLRIFSQLLAEGS